MLKDIPVEETNEQTKVWDGYCRCIKAAWIYWLSDINPRKINIRLRVYEVPEVEVFIHMKRHQVLMVQMNQ